MKTTISLPILLLSVLAFSLYSCKQKPSQSDNTLVLDIPALMENKGEIRMSDLCESVDFVVIQPNDAWFFPGYSISSKVFNNYILFFDRNSDDQVSGLFKRTGEFVLKLNKHGKGPGEYNEISDIGMDPAEKKIWILEGFKPVVHWYDLQGNWLETIKLPTDVSNISVMPDGDFLVQNNRWVIDQYDSSRLLRTDKTGRFLQSVWYKPKKISDRSNWGYVNWIFNTDLEWYYRDTPFSDTIYNLNRQYQLKPFLIMNPGKLRLPEDLLDRNNAGNDWLNYVRMNEVFLFRNHLLLSGSMKNLFYLWVDRKTGASVCSEKVTDDLLGLKRPFFNRSGKSDYLFRTIYIPSYKDHPEKLFEENHAINEKLQEKLLKTIEEAPENLDMIMVFYKVR